MVDSELWKEGINGFQAIAAILGYFYLGHLFTQVGYGATSLHFWLGFMTILFLQAVSYRMGASSGKTSP